MEWSDEPRVIVYTRDTEDYLALSWEARAVWHELVRKLDHRGFVEVRRGRRELAARLRVPVPVVESAVTELIEDGRLVEMPTGYMAPEHEASQGAVKSGRLRMAEARARSRASRASQTVAPRHYGVTKRNVDVTNRHDDDPDLASQTVAPRHYGVTKRNVDVTNRHETLEIRPEISLRISPDLQALPPELPDSRTIVVAEHGAPVRAPGQIPAVPDQRIKLNHQAWTYAAGEHARLRAAGISPTAVAWPAMPAGAPMGDLVKRTAEVLAMTDPPDYDAAWAMIKRRIDVAAAEATRVGNLKWFTPSLMWGGDVGRGFWRALEFTPHEAAEPRLPAGARPPATEPPRRIKTLP